MLRWKYSRPLLGLLLPLLALAPVLGANPLSRPGLQQTMAVAFIWGGLALTYDLLFGFTGLLSFGHALYFATGVYVSCILINHEVVVWWLAALISIAVSALLALLVGTASLRTTGITFAMVTLAFGEAGHVIIQRNFFNLTGGENGIALNADRIPSLFISVANTKFIYWAALAALIFTYGVIWWVTESSAGRVFAALRDNELRVQVLGLNTQRYKLFGFCNQRCPCRAPWRCYVDCRRKCRSTLCRCRRHDQPFAYGGSWWCGHALGRSYRRNLLLDCDNTHAGFNTARIL